MTELKVVGYVLPVKIEQSGVQWADDFDLELPAGAQLLSPDAHGPACILYVLVDPKLPLEKRSFRLVESNSAHSIDGSDHHAYVGTFATYDRSRVFHLFERVSSTPQYPTVGKKVH